MEYKKLDLKILAAVAVVFFFSSLVLSFGMPRIFISPDETANFFFTTQFIEDTRLYFFEPLNASLNDTIFPRSVVSLEGRLVPVSFVGLSVLYGLLGKITGADAVVLFTPLIAVLALFAWRAIVEKLFNRNLALFAALVLAFHPAWWYYTARSMMHNTLFVSLIIFAAWFILIRPIKPQWNLILGALMLALAFWVRTAELFWIIPVVAMLSFWFIKKVKVTEAVIFLLTLVISVLPILCVNNALYGDYWTVGYTVEAESGFPLESSEAQEVVEAESLLPFEFSERAILKNSFYYGLVLFWWISLLVILGLFVLISEKHEGLPPKTQKARLAYHATFFVTGGLLALAYGSWVFYDNPDPNSITIANSYVRYWLPVFVLSTVYAAGAIDWLRQRPLTELARTMVAVSVLVVVAALGVRGTFLVPDDGLFAVRETLNRNYEIKQVVLALTEEDAVIVVDRADKLFFPDRRVTYPLRSDHTYELLPRVLLRVPLYYYGITFPESDLEYLNTRRLYDLGLRIELVETFDEESLYRIYERHE